MLYRLYVCFPPYYTLYEGGLLHGERAVGRYERSLVASSPYLQ